MRNTFLKMAGLWLLAVAAAVIGWIAIFPKPPIAETDPATLVRGYIAGRYPAGTKVKIFGQFPMEPTSDPLTFDYVPGTGIPQTLIFVFDKPPLKMRDRPSWTIVGEVAEFVPDKEIRIRRVPGILVVRKVALVID